MRRAFFDDIDLFVELIPEGEMNAIRRDDLTKECVKAGLISKTCKDKDRSMRKLLHTARLEHCILTRQSGGYYRPTANEWKQIFRHRATERKRAISTLRGVVYDAKLYEDYAKDRMQ